MQKFVMSRSLIFLCFLLLGNKTALGGIIGYGLCQSGCNALVVSCYAAAGFTFGTITGGLGAPAVILGCNAGLGTCIAFDQLNDDFQCLLQLYSRIQL